MTNYHKGKIAEFMARLYMALHGYRTVCRNYAGIRGSGIGEIDFVAKRGRTLVFVEVKQRSNLDSAAYAISKEQQNRLIRGAQNFIKTHPQYTAYDFRFDALLITFPCRIKHLKNAWQA